MYPSLGHLLPLSPAPCKPHFLFFSFHFWPRHMACGILVPDQGSKLRPLHWKRGVLTTGPPGKSQASVSSSIKWEE